LEGGALARFKKEIVWEVKGTIGSIPSSEALANKRSE